MEEFLGASVPVDDSVRERVVLVAGKVAGVDCPNCQYESRDTDVAAFETSSVTCPECGTTILTTDGRTALRQAGKL